MKIQLRDYKHTELARSVTPINGTGRNLILSYEGYLGLGGLLVVYTRFQDAMLSRAQSQLVCVSDAHSPLTGDGGKCVARARSGQCPPGFLASWHRQ